MIANQGLKAKVNTSQITELPNQDSRLGPSWVLVLLKAFRITVKERQLALQMCFYGQDDGPEKMAQKWLIFTSKWTTVRHHSVVDALLNTHLPSFNSPVAIKEQRPSLETPTRHTDDRPEFSGRSS